MSRGRPKGTTKEFVQERYDAILEIAREHTELAGQPQSKRHIYYLCSGNGIVGKDHGQDKTNYNIVRGVIGKALWGKELDWKWIVDGTRELSLPTYFESVEDVLEAAKRSFALDHWKYQDTRVILCSEKDAIEATLQKLCHELQVPFMSFRGQNGDIAINRLAEYISNLKCKRVHILYYGDCDPSGLTIDRSVFEGKLDRMLWDHILDYIGEPKVEYTRIGITRDDLLDPANADYIVEASRTDKNYASYISEMGTGNTLGIDALDSAELIRRARHWIERRYRSASLG